MYTYSIYGHIRNIYIIIDILVWAHTPRTNSSLGQIYHTSWDTYVEVTTSECRKELYIYIYEIISITKYM